MNTYRLDRRIVFLAILMLINFNPYALVGQGMIVNCPNPDTLYYSCLDEVPLPAMDSSSFVLLEGASIENVSGELTINVVADTTDNSGCSLDTIFVTHTYDIADDDENVECVVVHAVSQTGNGPEITCEDIIVYLDENGSYTLTLDEISFTIETECNIPAMDTILSISSFTCEDINGSPVENTITVTDACNVSVLCNFSVYVFDQIPPNVTCNDDITVNLESCVCEATVFFDPPVVEDNCPGDITINRIDTTGLNSGDIFPAGRTTIHYEVFDASNNRSTCFFNIDVIASDPGSIACKGDQNVSLNADCEALIIPEMLVSDPLCDLDTYIIVLFDELGNQLDSNLITGEYLGTVITARISYECYNNYCEVSLNIEDKMMPVLNCEDTTISCGEAINYPLPEVEDNCGQFTVVLLNNTIEDVSCGEDNIDKIITRTYGVRDENGVITSTCEQQLFIEKFDISEITPPASNVQLTCGGSYPKDNNGHPDPSESGAPMLDGVPLWPPMDVMCNLAITYIDSELPGSPCNQQIVRDWTVLNWYCSNDGMRSFRQFIAIVDNEAPVFECPSDVTIYTPSNSCNTPYSIPALDISDACQEDVMVDITYPGGFISNSNGAEVELELGEQTITYTVRDICGNSSSCSYIVTVVDNTQPIALCDNNLNLSLSSDGTAIVDVTVFDKGSLDECSDVTVEIARMDDPCEVDGNTELGDYIVLCCEDVGNEVMVLLRVTDAAGNYNECMSIINVLDLSDPVLLSDLPDITVSNDFAFSEDNLAVFGIVEQTDGAPGAIIIDADSVSFSGPAVNAVVTDNCSAQEVEENATYNIDMCGLGTIIRDLTVSDVYGNSVTLDQTITFINSRPFTEDSITWPSDITINNECNPNLDPIVLNSEPQYDDYFSGSVSHTYDDITVSEESSGCKVIDRIWYVSDWCNRINGSFAVYTDTQQITIIDLIPPTITAGCTDVLECSFSANCGGISVILEAEGTDNCAGEEELQWTLEIDYGSDSEVDITFEGNLYEGVLPVGIHEIRWILEDGCGNADECSYTYEVENCKNPTPICLTGQEFFISPIDTSGDDTPDLNGVIVNAKDIDGGSFSACGEEVFVSFSEAVDDTIRILECEDLGEIPIMLWATDESGNQDFCNVFITVSDTSMVCDMVDVQGVIFGNDIDFISGVNLILRGSEQAVVSDEYGFFSFSEMPMGGQYELVPAKNDDAKSGVTTSDLVLIQRHILGITPFESPYKIIAADVDQSNSVTATDLLEIRKLILGRIDQFKNNKSWAFVPSEHIFIDAHDPWATEIPFIYAIPRLTENMFIDFIGVKLGDVNESVEKNHRYSKTRANEQLLVGRSLDKNDVLEFKAGINMSVSAIMIEMDLNASLGKLVEVISMKENASVDYHYVTEHKVRILFSNFEDISLNEGETILNIKFDKEMAGNLESLISFSEAQSEAVYENGMALDIDFIFETGEDVLRLMQNAPNPWTSETTFKVYIPKGEVVNLNVTDISGRLISSKELNMIKGINEVSIDRSELSDNGGMYFYEITSSYGKIAKKMMLLAR